MTTIKPTGYALCNNLLQVADTIMDDFDKALGMQELGAFALRSVEDIVIDPGAQIGNRIINREVEPKVCTYEGLHSLVAEAVFMLSEVSRRASQAEVATLINQGVLYEVMSVFGLPIEPKTFDAYIGKEDDTGIDIKSRVYYPAFKTNAPKISQMFAIILQNIAPLLANNVTLPPEDIEQIQNMTEEEVLEYIEEIKQAIDDSSNSGGSPFGI